MRLPIPNPYSRKPKVWEDSGNRTVYEFTIPYTRGRMSWHNRVLAAAPRTHRFDGVLGDDTFPKPKTRAKAFTLLLVQSGGTNNKLNRGVECEGYAIQNGVYPASARHILDAAMHLGQIGECIKWWGSRGPGIVAPAAELPHVHHNEARYCFCLWYRPGEDARAQLMLYRAKLHELTLFAFVREPWQAVSAAAQSKAA